MGHPQVGSSPEFTYGVGIGHWDNKEITMGLNINYFSSISSGATVADYVEYKVMPVLFELTYYFNNPLTDSTGYVGGYLGVARTTLIVGNTFEDSETPKAFGGKVGISFRYGSRYSIAPELSLIQIMGNKSVQLLSGQAVFIVWF